MREGQKIWKNIPLFWKQLCVCHVIWTQCRIFKSVPNVEMFIYFFVYPFTLNNTKAKIIQYLTPISTFDALFKWHDPHISNVKTKWEIFFQFVWPSQNICTLLARVASIKGVQEYELPASTLAPALIRRLQMSTWPIKTKKTMYSQTWQ